MTATLFQSLLNGLASGISGQRDVEDVSSEAEARRVLIPFSQRLFPRYRASQHHHLIAEQLEKIAAGEIQNLIIIMPPRHGKSELASINFPAWFLGNYPDQSIIAASHTARLAYRFSRRVREKFRSPAWPFDVRLKQGANQIEQWEIEGHRGGYYAVGVGGTPTGVGADILLVDDAVKNREEADSPTMRENAWEWWQGTMRTRLEPGGRIVLIGTRWHEDDLIGRVLKHAEATGEQWVVLHLDAICETDADLLGRERGEALWPERWPVPALLERKSAVGAREWTAQYQGRPTSAEGAIIKRNYWQFCTPDELFGIWKIQIWDTAFKKGQENDFSACVTWAVRGNRAMLIDLWMARCSYPELKRAFRANQIKHNPLYVGVEDAASGQSLIQDMQEEPGMTVIALPAGDKVIRAHEVTPLFEAAQVAILANQWFTDQVIEQCAAFPVGEHDDIVDAVTHGLKRIKADWASGYGVERATHYVAADAADDEDDDRWR